MADESKREHCMTQANDMSDRDDNEDLIKNPDTLTRRAWVDLAVKGVRRRLDLDPGLAEAAPPAEPPQLYVVPSRKR
jgi:hypothetical protein